MGFRFAQQRQVTYLAHRGSDEEVGLPGRRTLVMRQPQDLEWCWDAYLRMQR